LKWELGFRFVARALGVRLRLQEAIRVGPFKVEAVAAQVRMVEV
jgi:hypothetical protein